MNGTAITATRFLVSVRSPEEALIAREGGADIIDAKEPSGGALGAVPPAALRAIVEAVDGRRPVSATVGDCTLDEAATRVITTARTGADYVKIGLFGEVTTGVLRDFERCATQGIRLIAVMFADREPQSGIMKRLARAGFAGVMLDTAGKECGSLRSHLGADGLSAFLAEARSHGLLAGLAGSLQQADASALLPLRPDVLGFRGALCGRGARTDALSPVRVRAMRRVIPLTGSATPALRPAVIAMAEED